MKKVLFLIAGAVIILASCNEEKKETEKSKSEKNMEKELSAFIDKLVAEIKPLETELSEASFAAAVSGKDEDYEKSAQLEIKYRLIYTDKKRFEELKNIKENGNIKDELLKRQLENLYNDFLSMQIDEEKMQKMVMLANEVDKKFSNFRTTVDGKKLTDNEVEDILRTSADNKKLEKTWTACKDIGPVVSEDVKTLVKMRNEVAKDLGFNNYHEMSLKLGDQDPQEISKLFDELDNLTRDAYIAQKKEIDSVLAAKYKLKPEELKPWHYQNRFFQEAPQIYKVDLDKYYAKKDIVALTKDYFESIGLPIADLIEKSDLFEKPGKNQHAFCSDFNREGDVRVLCNVKPNNYWMNTMLHEYGHAVYDKFNDRDLAFLLRSPAHAFTTEAIAMLFGRFSANAQWIQDMTGINDEEKTKIAEDAFKTLRLEQLVFSRWAQVMYRFEKAMYENPDQDLNALWWNLVEKYQMVKKPEGRDMPDWATKTHIASTPCYYHNYLMGELLASQLYYKIVKDVIKSDDYSLQSFKGNTEVGKFLTENVFKPGNRWYWNDMIEKATGEKLTAKYYAKQFVGGK